MNFTRAVNKPQWLFCVSSLGVLAWNFYSANLRYITFKYSASLNPAG
jgi:hypothetical protein